MNRLIIKLNTITENVTLELISKLYTNAKEIKDYEELNEIEDSQVELLGNLQTPNAYDDEVTYLETKFPNLHINVTVGRYIKFEDPEVQRVFANRWGDGNGVTLIDMANVTEIPKLFENNKVITSFDELGKFTNITSINAYVFKLCSALASIDLSNIISIGNQAFADCSALTSVNLSNCTSIGENTFSSCLLLTSVGDLSNVISIGSNAFSNCSSLTTVDLSNCTSIGNNTFDSCSLLTSVGDTSNITSIGAFAFLNCSALTSIDLSNVTSIGNQTFLNCSALTTVGDLSNCTSLGGGAFLNCSSLTTIGTLNSSITSIPYSCFKDCTSLTTFDFSNITSVGSNAFNSCTSLGTGQTLDLNLSNLTSYPETAFRGTNYSKLILHCPLLTGAMDTRYPVWYGMPNVTYIDLSDFLISKSVFDNSLYSCPGPEGNTSIVTFIYPSNVTYIGTTLRQGRYYNTYRYAIILAITPPSINKTDRNNPPSIWFNNSNLHIYVPDSAKLAYLADTDWATIGGHNGSVTITDRLHGLSELPAGVWTTGLAASKYHFFNDPEVTRTLTLAYAVEDGVALTNSDIASIISNDGYTDSTFSFKNNTDLVDFSDLNKLTNVTWLNYEAFDGCTSLQNINLSNIVNLSYTGGMTENYTFRNCSSLEYIYLPNATGFSLYNLCLGCTSLKLYIAPNVTGIGRLNGPFVNCLNLKGIFIPKCNMGDSSADLWHEDAFIGGCGNIKVVDVDIITSINEYTFRTNTSLSAVIFRNTTTVPTLTGETSSYFSNITFYVDDNMLSAYQADSAWSNANIHLDVISNFVLADHLDSDTLTLYNSIINPS